MSSEEPIDVLLVGLGALGGMYSYVLERSQRCRITAITRSLYDSIQTHGLTINSKKYGSIPNWKPFRLVQSAKEALDRNYRFIICCVKCLPDVEPTSAILAPFLLPAVQASSDSEAHPLPTLVLMQNGIGVEQPLAEAFPSIHIISCVSWIAANLVIPPPIPDKTSNPHLKKPIPSVGPTIEHGAQDRIAFGLYEGEGLSQDSINTPDHQSQPRTCNQFVEGLLSLDGTPLVGPAREEKLRSGKEHVKLFEQLLIAGGSSAEAVEHIQPTRWTKNLWNGTFSSMCTLSRTPVAQLIAPEVLPYTLPVIRRTMLEILYVGRSLGYSETEFPAKSIDDTIQFTIQAYQSHPLKKTVSQSSRSPHPSSKPIDSKPLSSTSNQPGRFKNSQIQSPDDNVFDDDDDDEEEEEEEEHKSKATSGTQGPELDNLNSSPAFKPSMLIDLEMNRPLELEPIIGAVLDRARSKAVETPRLDMLYSALKVLQEQAVRQHAAKLKTQQQEKHLHHWAMRKPSIGGSGTSDSRQAWLNEVKRRSILGECNSSSATNTNNAIRNESAIEGQHTHSDENRILSASMPSRDHKVTGKPLA